MSVILIACALPLEAALLGERLPPGDWRLIATGLGAAKTRRSLERRFALQPPGLLIFTGSAGALDPTLDSGEIVFPERWTMEAGGVFAPDPDVVKRLRERGWAVTGNALTVPAPVVESGRRAEIFRQCEARVCDMESAAALETAARSRIPAVALKVVADSVRDPAPAADVAAFRERLRQVMPNLAAALVRLLTDLDSDSRKWPGNPRRT